MNTKSQLNQTTATFIYLPKKVNRGFSIIELVLVIVLMGILTVTVAPKLFNSNGFDEYTYQAEIVSVLRSAQLRAMQQTQSNNKNCHTVTVTDSQVGLSDSCNLVRIIPGSSDPIEYEPTELHVPRVINGGDVIFSTNSKNGVNSSIIFDSLGKPVDTLGQPAVCNDASGQPSTCNITISGAETLTVIVESEGFIHAG